MPDFSLIDSHCHLDFPAFEGDREQVINRSVEHNISNIIIPGTQKKYWQRIKSLCATNHHLHACYGLHPYWVQNHSETDIAELDLYIEHNNPIAVGECGLDFRPQQADKKTQLFFFNAQLDIAHNRNLPVVIHSVKATEMVIKIIRKYKKLRGMIHSYSGSLEQARQLIDMGFYISISGSVTYENASKVRSTVSDIPLTSILLETDAPDQPDQSHQGERNEPAYVVNTLQSIAEIRKTTIEEVAQQTTQNAKDLFNI